MSPGGQNKDDQRTFDSMLSKKGAAVKDAQTSPGEFRLPSKDSTMTNNVPETALLGQSFASQSRHVS